jgi:translation initiation factor IF-3
VACALRVNTEPAPAKSLRFMVCVAADRKWLDPLFLFVIMIRRCIVISRKDLMINEEIREKEVRVIDSDGSQLGIIPSRQAFEIAMSKNLDLVMIAPKA